MESITQRLLLLWMGVFFLIYYFGFHDSSTPITSRHFEPQLNYVDHVKRNAPSDNMKQFLEHSSTISRIANGITLQSGLMDKTIPMGAAVGELLNFGNVKVSDVANFKPDNVKALVEKLKVVPTSLDSSISKLEDTVVKLNQIRIDSDHLGDLSKIPEKAEYFTALKSYKADLEMSKVTDAHATLESIAKKLKEIEQRDPEKNDPQYLKNAFNDVFNPLPGYVLSAETELAKVKNLADKLDKAKVFKDGSSTFSPIRSFLHLVIERSVLKERSSLQNVDVAKNNFQTLDGLKSMFQSSKSDILRLSNLAESRSSNQKRKFTTAFPLGISDAQKLIKDIRDPWFEQVTDKQISVESLLISLTPWFKLEDLLTKIDGKLGKFGDLGFLKSIQENLEKNPSESASSAAYLLDIDKCHMTVQLIPDHYAATQTVMEQIASVGTTFDSLSSTIKKLDVEKYKAAMDSFITFLGFTDITDAKKSPAEVPGVLKRLKGSEELETFKKLIEDIKKGLDITALDTVIQKIVPKENSLISSQMNEEFKVYTCLKGLKDKFEKIVPAILATQKLRSLDTGKLQHLDSAISSVSAVTKDLANLKSMPETMKAEAKTVTNDVNLLPAEVAKTIGGSVNSLQSAHELKQFNLDQLKNIGKKVESGLRFISNSKPIKDNWGNHNQDIATLESAVLNIKLAEKNMKLSDFKSIGDHGKPFLELVKLSDVNINTKGKIQALKALISKAKDPAIKSELEKSEADLEKLDSLDLQFSSHKSQFQSAPKAFQDLYDFLVKFSREAEAAKLGKDGPNYAAIFGGSGGALLGLLFAGSVLVYIKYFKNRVSKKALRTWIRKQLFTAQGDQKYCDAYRCHEAYMKAMEIYTGKCIMDASYEYLPLRKSRGQFKNIGCNPATALQHLKKDGRMMPIHANYVISPNGKKFFATQAPVTPDSFRDDEGNSRTDDTREDFWHMVMLEKVEFVVMLCAIDELKKTGLYFPANKDEVQKYGRYELKTLSCDKKEGYEFIDLRRVEIIDTTGKLRKRVITHVNYTDWPDMLPPYHGNIEDAFATMKIVEGSKKPVVVHCMAGIGRTMAFIGVHSAAEAVKQNPKMTMLDELSRLREARWMGVQTIRQSYWLQVAVCHRLNDEYKLGLDGELKEIMDTFIQVSYKNKGPDEIMGPRIKRLADMEEAEKNNKEFVEPEVKHKKDEDFGTYIDF